MKAEKEVSKFIKNSPYDTLYLDKLENETKELQTMNERIKPKLDEFDEKIAELRKTEKFVNWVDKKIEAKKREADEAAMKAREAAHKKEQPVSLRERIDALQRQERTVDVPRRSHRSHSYDMER